jgi:hypothetical protein
VENARFILRDDEVVSLAWDVEKKCTALSDDVVHGRSLLKLGIALNKLNNGRRPCTTWTVLGPCSRLWGTLSTLLVPISVISWVHLDEHRLPDALDAIEEAWKYAELTASRYIQMKHLPDLRQNPLQQQSRH